MMKKEETIVKDEKTYKKYKNKDGIESVFEKINKEVDVAELLTLLDNKYEVKKDRIRESGELCSGYRRNVQQNYLVDFSGHGRAVGSPFSVAKHYIGDDKRTFIYFAETRKIGKIEEKKTTFDPTYKKEDRLTTRPGEVKEYSIKAGNNEMVVDFEALTTYRLDDNGNKIKLMDAAIEPIGYYQDGDENIYIVHYKKGDGSEGYLHMGGLGQRDKIHRVLSTK